MGDITDGDAATESNTRLCDTMLLAKGEHRLEMKLDRTTGLGKGEYVDPDRKGAFTAAYGSAESGKAYFNLISTNGVTIPAGSETEWRGTYRFYTADAADTQTVKRAVTKYIKSQKNNVTYDGIAAAARTVEPTAVINQNNCYIKYAVPGVSDNDEASGYPLNIPGSDGAVFVSLAVNGSMVDFVTAFGCDKEILKTDKTAVAGINNDLLYYDDVGNIIGCAAGVSKIVIPESFNGTVGIPDFAAYPAMNNVECIIIENTVPLVQDAFNASETTNWKSLKAFSFNAGKCFSWSDNKGFMTYANLRGLPALKYVALPGSLDNDYMTNWVFSSLSALENINIPLRTYYMYGGFTDNAVREYKLGGFDEVLNWQSATGEDYTHCFSGGSTVRIIKPEDKITFSQAVAILAAQVSETDYTSIPDDKIKALAWSAESYDYLKSVSIIADTDLSGEVCVSFACDSQTASALFTAEKITFYAYDCGDTLKLKISTEDVLFGMSADIVFGNSNLKLAGTITNESVNAKVSLNENRLNVSFDGKNSGDLAIIELAETDNSPLDFTVGNCRVYPAVNNPTSFTVTDTVFCADATGDNMVNILDFIRLKKYFLDFDISKINEKNVLGESCEITSAKLTELRKMLLGNCEVTLEKEEPGSAFAKPEVRAEAAKLGLTQDVLEDTLTNRGSMARLADVIKRAERGEDITIGAIGGSITEGTAASVAANRYFDRFCDWWEAKFPDSKLTRINAGKGATDSLMGVHRADNDLLSYKPDLVIADFTVNDPEEALYAETYEGLIRKILKQDNNPALIMLMMVKSDGTNAAEYHVPLGKLYDLPIVDYKQAIKNYSWGEISPDTIHPNDIGHAIVSEALIYCVETAYANLDKIFADIGSLPAPVTNNAYESGIWYNSTTLSPDSFGSFRVDASAFQFGNGWSYTGVEKEPIVFTVNNAKNIYVLYKVSTASGAGIADISIDGDTPHILNGAFPGGWGNYTASYALLNGNISGTHTVTITPSTGTEFTVIGILVS